MVQVSTVSTHPMLATKCAPITRDINYGLAWPVLLAPAAILLERVHSPSSTHLVQHWIYSLRAHSRLGRKEYSLFLRLFCLLGCVPSAFTANGIQQSVP